MLKTHRSFFVLGALVALALAACGGGSSEATESRTAHHAARRARPRAADDDRPSAREESERIAREEERRRERALPTATDQSEAADDVEITRQIRVAVVGDSSLSLAARNVTIITRDAVVTLRGDVRSNAEREAIERHAQRATGVERIENLLSVDVDEDE